MHREGSSLQSTSQRKISQLIHPIGGVRASLAVVAGAASAAVINIAIVGCSDATATRGFLGTSGDRGVLRYYDLGVVVVGYRTQGARTGAALTRQRRSHKRPVSGQDADTVTRGFGGVASEDPPQRHTPWGVACIDLGVGTYYLGEETYHGTTRFTTSSLTDAPRRASHTQVGGIICMDHLGCSAGWMKELMKELMKATL